MIGQVLGSYRLEAELGAGGMGKVYAATVVGRCPGLDTGARVALKVVHPHLLEQAGFFKRFLREAEIGRSVEHANVIRTLDCDQLVVAGAPNAFLVMEYVEGQTLRDLLTELDRVPEELCRHIGREVANGLAAIHDAGVVHRDLKPENVLITADHEVKVMDLGVARLQDEVVRLSQTGAFVGSIHYAAPEQFGKGQTPDHRVDLHALGLLLYELGCGIHPYYDEDYRVALQRLLQERPRRIHEINPQLSPFYEEVVHTLLAKDRDERFATAAMLAAVLEDGETSEWWKERAKQLRLHTRQPLRRIRIVRETALYGRDTELAKLQALYEQAEDGDGRVLLVEGEAGIGKTRLVDEFIGRLRQEGEDLNFLFGSYPPTGAATAAGALSTAFREHLGPEGSAPYLPETPLLVPAFDAVLLGDAAPKDAEPLTKDSLGTCFVHATRALAAERPTVVLIDDLHFAPEDARGLFTSLALAVRGHRILLIGTMRPGVPEDWVANISRQEHGSHTTLSRLGPKDLAALLKDSFRSERLAHELGVQIGEKSDGNPFFAFEIIRGLREGQFITQQGDGTWVSTRVIEQIQIPSSVMDLIHARIADLSEEEKDLLDVASCCGFEFDPSVVAAALDMQRIPALKRFGNIEKRHRLVRSSGRNMVFDHHQVQEALYAGMLEQLREEYHAAIAEALEAKEGALDSDPKDLDGDLFVELCEHFFRGARGERAMRYFDAALVHLETGYLIDQAVALIDRALSVPDLTAGDARVSLLLRKAYGCQLLSDPVGAWEPLKEAKTIAQDDGAPALLARVGVQQALQLNYAGRYAEATDVASSALDSARRAVDPRAEFSAQRVIAWSLVWLGRVEEALSASKSAIALTRELNDEALSASAAHLLAHLLQQLGRYAEAQPYCERFLATARERGDRWNEAGAWMALGINHLNQGRLDVAVEYQLRALSLAREIGARTIEARACGNLGIARRGQGRFHEALALSERHLAIARETGDRRAEVGGGFFAAQSLVPLGRLAEARDHVSRARDLAGETGEIARVVNCDDLLGWIFLRLGAMEQARERFLGVRETHRRARGPAAEAWAQAHLGDLALWSGLRDEARTAYESALATLRESAEPEHLVLLIGGLAQLAAEDGRLAEAASLLEEVLAHADPYKDPVGYVRALTVRAAFCNGDAAPALEAFAEHGNRIPHFERMDIRHDLWIATGDTAHLSAAKELLDFAVEHAPEEYREAMVTNVPPHREILAACKEHGL